MHNFLDQKVTVFSVAEWTGKLRCSCENIGISRAQYEFDIATLIDVSCRDLVYWYTLHSNWNMNRSQLGSRYFSKVMTIPFLRTINCFEINSFSVQHISFNDMKSRLSNRPFAGSGHMVRNKLHWDANDAVGLSKQRNSYQSSPTFLCFESPIASFASQCDRILQRAIFDEWHPYDR